jgi:hypothetical protein
MATSAYPPDVAISAPMQALSLDVVFSGEIF